MSNVSEHRSKRVASMIFIWFPWDYVQLWVRVQCELSTLNRPESSDFLFSSRDFHHRCTSSSTNLKTQQWWRSISIHTTSCLSTPVKVKFNIRFSRETNQSVQKQNNNLKDLKMLSRDGGNCEVVSQQPSVDLSLWVASFTLRIVTWRTVTTAISVTAALKYIHSHKCMKTFADKDEIVPEQLLKVDTVCF